MAAWDRKEASMDAKKIEKLATDIIDETKQPKPLSEVDRHLLEELTAENRRLRDREREFIRLKSDVDNLTRENDRLRTGLVAAENHGVDQFAQIRQNAKLRQEVKDLSSAADTVLQKIRDAMGLAYGESIVGQVQYLVDAVKQNRTFVKERNEAIDLINEIRKAVGLVMSEDPENRLLVQRCEDLVKSRNEALEAFSQSQNALNTFRSAQLYAMPRLLERLGNMLELNVVSEDIVMNRVQYLCEVYRQHHAGNSTFVRQIEQLEQQLRAEQKQVKALQNGNANVVAELRDLKAVHSHHEVDLREHGRQCSRIEAVLGRMDLQVQVVHQTPSRLATIADFVEKLGTEHNRLKVRINRAQGALAGDHEYNVVGAEQANTVSINGG